MVIVKLTEELLPYFIYLIDEIEVSNNDFVIRDLFNECSNKDISTSWHSLSRVFAFRQILRKGLTTKQNFTIPKKKTLDALTKYYYGEDFIFRDLVKNSNNIDVNPTEVAEYYLANAPKNEIIIEIFKKRPAKLEHIQEQLDSCLHLLKELESSSISEYIANEVDNRFDILKKEIKEELDLKIEIIQFLENKVNQLEKKRRRSSFIYRLLGSFGLFFVNVEYDEVEKSNLLEDFIDTYQGFTEDDALNDLLP